MGEEAKPAILNSDVEKPLSFSNLPLNERHREKPEDDYHSLDEQFEFRILGGGSGLSSKDPIDMCTAEDVFFRGQLLPLFPTQSFSQLDSSTTLSFDGSSCVSRNLSSNSCTNWSDALPPRRVRLNALYAYPSPSPRVTSVRKNVGVGSARSTGSVPPAGWGLLKLGVVTAPEMELQDIRVRRAGPKLERTGGVMEREKRGSVVWRLLGGGLMGCRCSPEVADTGRVAAKEVGRRSRVTGCIDRRETMFDWMKDLSLDKGGTIG